MKRRVKQGVSVDRNGVIRIGSAVPIEQAKALARERIKMKSKVTESGCWEWQGTLGQLGYGQTTFQNKKWIVHRLSYFVFKGDLRGLDVCHTCDNKKCCNPDHLWLGTHIENMDDHVFKGRHYELRKTHCVRGHPLSGDNLAWRFNRKRRRPTRICKECIRTRWRRERDQKANKC